VLKLERPRLTHTLCGDEADSFLASRQSEDALPSFLSFFWRGTNNSQSESSFKGNTVEVNDKFLFAFLPRLANRDNSEAEQACVAHCLPELHERDQGQAQTGCGAS